jgi:hypothetical protein
MGQKQWLPKRLNALTTLTFIILAVETAVGYVPVITGTVYRTGSSASRSTTEQPSTRASLHSILSIDRGRRPPSI